jgi:putative resolvase
MPVLVVQAPSGTWLVAEPEQEESGRLVAYCGVSSADLKPDLGRLVARVVQGATRFGLAVGEVVAEVGSGSVRAAAQTSLGSVGPCRYRSGRGAP